MIGAWKWNFPAFLINYEQPTDQPTDIRGHREVKLSINQKIVKIANIDTTSLQLTQARTQTFTQKKTLAQMETSCPIGAWK